MKNLKKIFIILIIFAISSSVFAAGENYNDYKAILMGDMEGNIVKEENGYAVRPLASVTKVMTIMLTLDKVHSGDISLNDRVIISETAAAVPYGVKLSAGGQYTVRDLLKATAIRSSNNAAYALAEYVSGGNVNEFVNSMNRKAKQFGWESLRFCSPHGLPPSYTGSCMDQGNARDLYKMAMLAVTYKEYMNIAKEAIDFIDHGNIKLTATNHLLGKVRGVDGLKTGYHNAAGSNIILTAERNNQRMILVILGSGKAKNRDAIGENQINYYYSVLNNSTKVIDKNEIVAYARIGNDRYGLYPSEDITVKGKNRVGNSKLTYKVALKDGVSRKDIGQIVGTFIATDGVNEYTGALIMK
ncbi:D-alanyl-D-alanine carboxypeptidase [Leptotrichia sp. OH3620_COT-345]|uniref:D-alanyl-D-alanine carboxypeptidase family protein n=1 Tax=Leptotrichia sp. OH3620_COT-345 TaxID=2491048 RepID=UPI000F65351C|nr:serine hydrolase [Leptotrichia sp. OH3620_COT-345]RRD39951.1 D-alanyl-D-alanine carboxypeptidase [Leptotrichia sp. OH3620_COT-345]